MRPGWIAPGFKACIPVFRSIQYTIATQVCQKQGVEFPVFVSKQGIITQKDTGLETSVQRGFQRRETLESGFARLFEREVKRCAVIDLRLGPDAPTVPVDDALDGCQPNASAGKFSGFVHTLKSAK